MEAEGEARPATEIGELTIARVKPIRRRGTEIVLEEGGWGYGNNGVEESGRRVSNSKHLLGENRKVAVLFEKAGKWDYAKALDGVPCS